MMFRTVLILLCPVAPASALRCPWCPLTGAGKAGTQRAHYHSCLQHPLEWRGLGHTPDRAGGPLYILFLKKSTYERGIRKEVLLHGVFFPVEAKIYICDFFFRKEKKISVSLCLSGFLFLSFCLCVYFCLSLTHTHLPPTHTHNTRAHTLRQKVLSIGFKTR